MSECQKVEVAGHFARMVEPSPQDIPEVRRILAVGTTPYVEQFLRAELAKLNERFPPSATPVASSPPQAARSPPRRIYESITSYAFSDGSNTASVIIPDIDGLAQAEVTFDPQPHSFSIVINREASGLPNLKLTVSPLYKKINPAGSRYTIKGKTVTVVLDKKKKTSWSKLKKGALDKKKPKTPDEKEDPNSAIMDMMRKMYDEGDDEMKRTIQKAMWEAHNKKDQDAT
jgi:calcyclin binding protein